MLFRSQAAPGPSLQECEDLGRVVGGRLHDGARGCSSGLGPLGEEFGQPALRVNRAPRQGGLSAGRSSVSMIGGAHPRD